MHDGLVDRRGALDILFILFHASLKTSASLLSGLVEDVLKKGPAFLQTLKDDRLLVKYIEEVNRLKPANIRFNRIAARDCTIGGRRVPKGATVVVDLQAANRDA